MFGTYDNNRLPARPAAREVAPEPEPEVDHGPRKAWKQLSYSGRLLGYRFKGGKFGATWTDSIIAYGEKNGKRYKLTDARLRREGIEIVAP